MAWTQTQLEQMATDYYQGRQAVCPAPCNARVDVQEDGSTGTGTGSTALDIDCGRCGQRAEYKPQVATSGWTPAQEKKLADDYWGSGNSKCPNDGTVIEFRKDGVLGECKDRLNGTCKRCGREFNA